jgi:hypothetical protein
VFVSVQGPQLLPILNVKPGEKKNEMPVRCANAAAIHRRGADLHDPTSNALLAQQPKDFNIQRAAAKIAASG